MSYPTACDGCQAGNHSEHIEWPDPLPQQATTNFVCGGGFCACQGQCEILGGIDKSGDIFAQLKSARNFGDKNE